MPYRGLYDSYFQRLLINEACADYFFPQTLGTSHFIQFEVNKCKSTQNSVLKWCILLDYSYVY